MDISGCKCIHPFACSPDSLGARRRQACAGTAVKTQQDRTAGPLPAEQPSGGASVREPANRAPVIRGGAACPAVGQVREERRGTGRGGALVQGDPPGGECPAEEVGFELRACG